jgi:hypothetical protein
VNPSAIKTKVNSCNEIVRVKTITTKRLRPRTVNLLQNNLLLLQNSSLIKTKTTNDIPQSTLKEKLAQVEMTDSKRNEDIEGWRSPKRRNKPTTSNTTEKLELKNTYEPLNSANADSDNEMEVTAQDQRVKEKLPPPIIVHGFFKDHHTLTNTLKNTVGNQYTIKYTKYNTNIYTKNKTDWLKLQEVLKNDEIEYHTYTHKNNKTHAFVLRGLHQGPAPKEVAEALVEEDVDANEIYNMRGTNWPTYLIITDTTYTLDKLERIKFILNTKVSWQRHFNNKIFVQCHRCQKWGHATANCHARAKCVKCAGDHLTRDCQLGKQSTPKCVNCEGDHTANNTKCPEYQRKLEAAQERRNRGSKNEKKIRLSAPPQGKCLGKKKKQSRHHC